MKRRSLLIVCLLIVCLVFSACGGGADGGDQAKQNVAVYGYVYPAADDWDPSSCFDFSVATLSNLYEPLLRYDSETDSFEYVLCDEYSASEDSMTWTFHIREGVTFHDGTPVNAEAVKYSFERTIEKGLGAAYIWAPVESFEVTDEYTLVMHLSYAAAMDLVCSSPYAAFVMSPTTIEEKGDDWIAAGNEAGSGPYYLAEPGTSAQAVLTKYDGYWGGWTEGQFDKVVIKNVTEASTRRMMLEKGEADFVSALTPEDLEALASNDDIVIKQAKSFENLYVLLNCESGPLSDVNVRKALSCAFPYDDVIEYALGGNATRATGPVPAGLWGHAEEGQIDVYDYDLEQAKAYLAESAYPDGGFSVELMYVTGIEEQRKLAELFQSELNKLNITLEISPLTADAYMDRGQSTNIEEHPDMTLLVWYPDVPSPYTFLYTAYHQCDPISFNFTYYKNDALDALMDEADRISATDRDTAIDMFIEAQQMIYEDAPAIIAYDLKTVECYRSSIEGYESDPCYPYTVFFYDCTRAQ